ncbi:rhodanese-like domain-containing protein [Ureibacillus sp. FSL K6-8385]|uniref:Rhodanese-like domain-containing protein n=1 Tax=Ureibacillus terrenus TaxID=118246 RepID=A0A540V6U2_9BACL|nr:rhodanese-like domain-containing protein [Ureibacillus terrenus]MED3660497.1 rhodanese-like domain-containing protein [Ureibacillus terrenus]MED3762650.1 rhodanese-like domain-containing protein [Ureibacillus terrenus]TQE92472.1 rhodanese-like domain-containing protein [Ureibacillus terrenus]
MKTMTTEELINLLDANEDLNIIDVREDFEVANGMIPGAVHIPLGELPERLEELDPSKEYIIVCRSGNRSGKACQFLESQGFNAVNLEGGMEAYDGELEFK